MIKSYQHSSFRKLILFPVVSIIGGIIFIASITFFFIQTNRTSGEIVKKIDSLTALVIKSTDYLINTENIPRAVSMTDSLLLSTEIKCVVFRKNGDELIFGRILVNGMPENVTHESLNSLVKSGLTGKKFSIKNSLANDVAYGEFYYSTERFQSQIVTEIIFIILKTAVACIFAGIFLDKYIKNRFSAKMLLLKNLMVSFSKGNFSTRSPNDDNIITTELSSAFNLMAERVHNHVTEQNKLIEKKSKLLQECGDSFESASAVIESIQSMTSTLRIALSTLNHLKESQEKINSSFYHNNMTRDDLVNHLSESLEFTGKIHRRISEAVRKSDEIITSPVKSCDPGILNLKTLIEKTLKATINDSARTEFTINTPENINLSPNQEVLSEVITNLASKAVEESHKAGSKTIITIDAGVDNGDIILFFFENCCSDQCEFHANPEEATLTGSNVESDIADIVENALKGKIEHLDIPGNGSLYKISFPSAIKAA